MIKLRAASQSLYSAAFVLSMGASAPALANTFSVTAGPIPLSPVPLNVCNGNSCVKTPPLGNVKLTVEVTPDDLFTVVPRIRAAACPPGQLGEALIVETSLRDATVGGTISGNAGSLLFTRRIQDIRLQAKRSIVISACTF